MGVGTELIFHIRLIQFFRLVVPEANLSLDLSNRIRRKGKGPARLGITEDPAATSCLQLGFWREQL